MTPLRLAALAACCCLPLLAGCGGADTETPTANANGGAAAELPETLFASTAPEGARLVAAAKTGAAKGDRVVLEGRIGGQRDPFIDGRAVFLVVDPSVPSCDELPGDTCKTPWDYCCEPRESLVRNMATIQVVDDSGRPLARSLRDAHGLAPAMTVVVAGTVEQADESGTFVVNAESIHVKGS